MCCETLLLLSSSTYINVCIYIVFYHKIPAASLTLFQYPPAYTTSTLISTHPPCRLVFGSAAPATPVVHTSSLFTPSVAVSIVAAPIAELRPLEIETPLQILRTTCLSVQNPPAIIHWIRPPSILPQRRTQPISQILRRIRSSHTMVYKPSRFYTLARQNTRYPLHQTILPSSMLQSPHTVIIYPITVSRRVSKDESSTAGSAVNVVTEATTAVLIGVARTVPTIGAATAVGSRKW